jgi:hypothetical protein
VPEPPDRLAGQWTPAGLGVHPAIGGGPLPAYTRRPHDGRLRAVLNPETESSRPVVIRGDALTGTSRTVYEAVTDVLADWTLAHPPTVAALAARLAAGIPERTVLWLGELRHFADADDGAFILTRAPPTSSAGSRTVLQRSPGAGQSRPAGSRGRWSVRVAAIARLRLVCLHKEATVGQDVVTEDRSAS